jgi:hypothetical protein
MSDVRRAIHDAQQAERRTDRQNVAIIALLVGIGMRGEFAINVLPPEGGDIEIRHVPTGREFTIDRNGVTREAST